MKLLENLPPRVRVVEVGPRDGLQNQTLEIPVDEKERWIRALAQSGLKEIEATSFVHPRWVPQLADGRELLSRLLADDELCRNVRFWALVPNRKGLEGALEVGLDHIAVFTAASETFNQKNINCSIAESLQRFAEIFDDISRSGRTMSVRGYLSTCFGCPYEGDVPISKVVEVARALHELGCSEVVISDTTGVAHPLLVRAVVEAVAAVIPRERIALHFHDTRGLAVSNVLVGLHLGIASYDASSGGLGGCPYAPGAAGNLAMEDLLQLLLQLGIDSDVDLDSLVEASLDFERLFPNPFPSRVLASRRPSPSN